MAKQPYKYWDRDKLFILLKAEALDYNIDVEFVRKACYSDKWDPIIDFNGCNMVQDDYHPFLPCFLHDFGVVVFGISNKNDKDLRNNLLKFGYSTFRATTWYFAVRIGSFYKIIKEKWL